jgi:hypothetical protein
MREFNDKCSACMVLRVQNRSYRKRCKLSRDGIGVNPFTTSWRPPPSQFYCASVGADSKLRSGRGSIALGYGKNSSFPSGSRMIMSG